jgi:hypothetical protein
MQLPVPSFDDSITSSSLHCLVVDPALAFFHAISSHSSSSQSSLQSLNVMHAIITILSVESSRISGQDTVDFVVVDVFIRVLLRIVDIGVLFIPDTNSLLLVSDSSSSTSAATEIL